MWCRYNKEMCMWRVILPIRDVGFDLLALLYDVHTHIYIYIYINSHRNDETTIAMTPHKPFATKSSLYKLNYLSDIRFNFITAKRLSIEWKHPTIYSQLIARCSPTVTMHKIWWERFDGMMRAATTAILPCMCLKLSEIWLTTVKWRYDSFMIIVH